MLGLFTNMSSAATPVAICSISLRLETLQTFVSKSGFSFAYLSRPFASIPHTNTFDLSVAKPAQSQVQGEMLPSLSKLVDS